MILNGDTVHRLAYLTYGSTKWQQLGFGARYILEESPGARLLSLILNFFSALTQTDVVADVQGRHALLGFLWVMSWTSLPLFPLKVCRAVRMAPGGV